MGIRHGRVGDYQPWILSGRQHASRSFYDHDEEGKTILINKSTGTVRKRRKGERMEKVIIAECGHQCVCKHYASEDNCSLGSICVHFIASGGGATVKPRISTTGKVKERRPYKKRGKPKPESMISFGGKKKDYSHLTTSNADIIKARTILRQLKVRGKLSKEQLASLEVYEGKSAKLLGEPEKQQILGILKNS